MQFHCWVHLRFLVISIGNYDPEGQLHSWDIQTLFGESLSSFTILRSLLAIYTTIDFIESNEWIKLKVVLNDMHFTHLINIIYLEKIIFEISVKVSAMFTSLNEYSHQKYDPLFSNLVWWNFSTLYTLF